MSASQYPPQYPPPAASWPAATPYGPIGPVAVPPRTKTPMRVAIIVLAVVILLGGLAFGVSRLVRRPADYPPPANYPPPPTLPKVLDDPVVTEAIDLFKKPKLGTPWDASGGAVPEGLRATPFITPCGVLVTLIQTGPSEDPQLMGQTRIVGYDIASGQQKWSVGLQQATGLTVPYYSNILGDVTYSGDCHMVLNFRENEDQHFGTHASLFVDLASGDVTTVGDQECQAAGAHWVGCFTMQDYGQSTAVKLDGSSTPIWTEPGIKSSANGDLVVAGFVRSDAGFRDPATGRVVFGADLATGKQAVMYVEPRRPGGYRSGLVFRVSGPIRDGKGQCQVTMWDPVTGQSSWPKPQSIDCGDEYSLEWGVAGQALIVSSRVNFGDTTTKAYSLVNGSMLWHRDGDRLGTPWDRMGQTDYNSMSLSETYVFLNARTGTLGFDALTIRIADGVEVNLTYTPAPSTPSYTQSLTINARVMAYDWSFSGLTAYAIDADKPDSKPVDVWSIPLRFNSGTQSTFATGGVMYLVHDLGKDGLQITPLLP